MKNLIIYLLLPPILSSCSLLGAKIGKEVDDSAFGDTENKHKYEAQYMAEGLEEDVEIIKAIFSKAEKRPNYIDPDPCKEKDSIQVCTVKKGCWCENISNK